MTQAQSTIQAIQAELAARVQSIGIRSGRSPHGELAREIDAIRGIAHRAGMQPVVTVAHALEAALARGEQGPLINGWLAILQDAVGSERQDRAACETYAAACSVRFSS